MVDGILLRDVFHCTGQIPQLTTRTFRVRIPIVVMLRYEGAHLIANDIRETRVIPRRARAIIVCL
jgi:hypothetical protein